MCPARNRRVQGRRCVPTLWTTASAAFVPAGTTLVPVTPLYPHLPMPTPFPRRVYNSASSGPQRRGLHATCEDTPPPPFSPTYTKPRLRFWPSSSRRVDIHCIAEAEGCGRRRRWRGGGSCGGGAGTGLAGAARTRDLDVATHHDGKNGNIFWNNRTKPYI